MGRTLPFGQGAPTIHGAPADEPRAARVRDLLDFGPGELTAVERWQIRFVRRTFESAPVDRVIRVLQRRISANWIDRSTRNLLHVQGVERLPSFGRDTSTILVANHRSFFDLFVVSSVIVNRGIEQRLMFPVRSRFFYDRPLGLAVNGAMSFFAMYPPVFRDRDRGRDRVALNRASVDEVIRVLRARGAFVGLHPEGKRNTSDDPYTLLPARPGVGRIIHETRGAATVIPVFVNGLGNDLVRQVAGNFLSSSAGGTPVTVVFGEPVAFGELLEGAPSPELDQRIAERALEAVRALGAEERVLRADVHASRASRRR
jgi:1-acyl-sn-glycerol-3-phosphate acyltransferase